jgi:hypothetical protein
VGWAARCCWVGGGAGMRGGAPDAGGLRLRGLGAMSGGRGCCQCGWGRQSALTWVRDLSYEVIGSRPGDSYAVWFGGPPSGLSGCWNC